MPPIRGALLDVVGLSREAVTLSELAQGALRGLQSAFGCSLGCFTHSPRDGGIEILNCTDAGVLQEYHRDWFAPIRSIRRCGGTMRPSWFPQRACPNGGACKDIRYTPNGRRANTSAFCFTSD
jgi:hypothetical protein